MDGNAALALLGLSPGASQHEIKAAFRRRAKLTHPDLGAHPGAFQVLRHAYAVALSSAAATPVTGAVAPATTAALADDQYDRGQRASRPEPRPGRWISTRADRRAQVVDRVDIRVVRPSAQSRPCNGRSHWSFDQHLAVALAS